MGKTFSLINEFITTSIRTELTVFFSFLALGSFYALIFVLLKEFKTAFKLKGFSLHLCDFSFCIFVGISFFWFSLNYTFGIIRLYEVMGSIIGIYLFMTSISKEFSSLFACLFKALTVVGRKIKVLVRMK